MPETSSVRSSAHRLVSFDETIVFYRRFEPVEKPRAVMFILHGMGEHSGRYREFAEFLASKGFACILPDLRGFGDSGGARGCVRRFTDYFKDLDAVLGVARSAAPDLPIFFLGHSFGGLLVSAWLDRNKLTARGFILSSPNFGITLPVPRWRSVLAQALSALWPDFTQDNRVDPTKLTHDTSLLYASASDTRIHHRISARLYTELIRYIAESPQTASRLNYPALILQAGDDHIVSRQATVDFYGELASRDKELKVYEGLYHEILNEPRRPEIFALIASWVEKRLVEHP